MPQLKPPLLVPKNRLTKVRQRLLRKPLRMGKWRPVHLNWQFNYVIQWRRRHEQRCNWIHFICWSVLNRLFPLFKAVHIAKKPRTTKSVPASKTKSTAKGPTKVAGPKGDLRWVMSWSFSLPTSLLALCFTQKQSWLHNLSFVWTQFAP